MRKSVKRISVLLTAMILVGLTITNAFAATIYYYFGYLYTNINNEKVSLYGVDDPDMNGLFVPATLNNKSLVDIRNNAFKNNTDFRYLEFAGATNLERIGSFAFSGCTAATGEVKIPANVTVVETAAFENCSSIESVVYNATSDSVPNQCFNGCTALSSVTLNSTVTSIGSYAFANCTNLTYLALSSNVTYIADSAFTNDNNLTLGVWFNSYAHTYAKSNNIPYRLLDEFRLGDVNLDGNVNINDVTAIQRHLASIEQLNDLQILAADVDRNGNLVINDATTIQLYIAGYTLPYPINQITTA